jgi:hypothetical protein
MLELLLGLQGAVGLGRVEDSRSIEV